MRIRMVPFALAVTATAVAVFAAVALGAVLMPALRSALATRGVTPLLGVWVALGVGVGTAVILALRAGDRRKKPDDAGR